MGVFSFLSLQHVLGELTPHAPKWCINVTEHVDHQYRFQVRGNRPHGFKGVSRHFQRLRFLPSLSGEFGEWVHLLLALKHNLPGMILSSPFLRLSSRLMVVVRIATACLLHMIFLLGLKLKIIYIYTYVKSCCISFAAYLYVAANWGYKPHPSSSRLIHSKSSFT